MSITQWVTSNGGQQCLQTLVFRKKEHQMKLEVQFERETRFDQPIRHISGTRARWSQRARMLSRTVGSVRRSKEVKPRPANGYLPRNSIL
jgi:hypothetical protein